jgi:hypothetical protein
MWEDDELLDHLNSGTCQKLSHMMVIGMAANLIELECK